MTTTTGKPLYSNLGDDPDLAEIVEMFVDEMPARTETFLNLLLNQDWDELGRVAHQLKGAAGSYGFDELSPIAANLEDAVRKGGSEEAIAAAVNELVDNCNRVRAGAPPM